MKSKPFKIYSLLILFLSAGCGGGGTHYATFDLAMPASLDQINTDYVRVAGGVSALAADGVTSGQEISAVSDSTLNISGHYVLPLQQGLRKDQNYSFDLTVYYQANAYTAPSLSALQNSTVEINANLGSCPDMSLSPDISLETDAITGGQWLVLCKIQYVGPYNPDNFMSVPESDIVCSGQDADGDGTSNLDEIAVSLDPYSGDYDGDCVADGQDAFPADPSESLDTDGDGVGDNSDSDADADGLINSAEASLGTDSLKADTDGDGVIDKSDNCPLDGSSADQTDTDGDSVGDICDTDADNDGLSDTAEVLAGTDAHNPDTDGDGLLDGAEATAGTNPLDSDSDDDGVLDGSDSFPVNSAESADTDDDGVGDHSDTCGLVADATNLDTDGDGMGDVCDTDDDGDGVSDSLEAQIGSNSLNPDSDGDGLTDWYGGANNGGAKTATQDGCLLIANQDATDVDVDGFNAACDCDESNAAINPAASDTPDTTGTDNNCDGVDGDKTAAIFVDGTNGSDSNSGSFGSPVATLTQAGSLAQAAGKDAYVASGTYSFTTAFTLPTGVIFYGGYSSSFASRALQTNTTTLSSTTLSTFVTASGTASHTGLDGFVIVDDATSSNVTLVDVESGTLSLANNTLQLGKSIHLTAVKAVSSTIDLTNNTLIMENRGAATNVQTAHGFYLDDSVGTISGNSLELADAVSERTAIYCVSTGDTPIIFTTNSLDVIEGVETVKSSRVYVQDCAGELHSSNETFDETSLYGFTASGSVLDTLF